MTKKGETRAYTHYTEEFKAQAVARVRAGDMKTVVCAEMGISSPSVLNSWVQGKQSRAPKRNAPMTVAQALSPQAVAKFHKALPAIHQQKIADLGIKAEDVEPLRQVLTVARHAGLSTQQVVAKLFERVLVDALKS